MDLQFSCFCIRKPRHQCKWLLRTTLLPQKPMRLGWWCLDTQIGSDHLQITVLKIWFEKQIWFVCSPNEALQHIQPCVSWWRGRWGWGGGEGGGAHWLTECSSWSTAGFNMLVDQYSEPAPIDCNSSGFFFSISFSPTHTPHWAASAVLRGNT